MKKLLLVVLFAVPVVCFGQAGVLRTVLKEGAALVSKETAKRAGEKKAISAAKDALRLAPKAEKAAAEKALMEAEKKAARNAIARAANYDAKLIVTELSERELKEIAIDMNLSYSKIRFTPEVVRKSLNYCKVNNINSSKAYNEMIDQMNRFSDVLWSEKNVLEKKVQLTIVEKERLKLLKSLFLSHEKALTPAATSALFNRLSKVNYKESSMLPLKDFVHIVLRHGKRSTEKSSFLAMNKTVINEIVNVAKDKKWYLTTKDDLKVFVKKYDKAIGVTKDGANANYVVVWVDKNTNKITSAFPADKTNKFVQMYEQRGKELDVVNLIAPAAITTSAAANDMSKEKKNK